MTEQNSFDFGDSGQDLLFTDGLPTSAPNTGYSGNASASAAGISYRQLDYWDRTGLVQPSVRGAAGSGTQRLYAFRDILVLKLVKRLLIILTTQFCDDFIILAIHHTADDCRS